MWASAPRGYFFVETRSRTFLSRPHCSLQRENISWCRPLAQGGRRLSAQNRALSPNNTRRCVCHIWMSFAPKRKLDNLLNGREDSAKPDLTFHNWSRPIADRTTNADVCKHMVFVISFWELQVGPARNASHLRPGSRRLRF